MPTIKQQIATKEIIENHRSVGSAMRIAGYKNTSATVPYNLTRSKGWAELLEKHLPDKKLFQVHNDALDATKVVSARVTGRDADSGTDDFIDVPDHPTRLRAVELGYRVKGKLKDSPEINLNQTKVLIMPEELIGKYEVPQDTIDSGK